MELRCQAKLHGLIHEHNLLEVKCNSRFCGARPGVVVLHYFDLSNGEMVETKRFSDLGGSVGTDDCAPPIRPEGGEDRGDDR
mgnify:CR=1 FL=1